MHVRRSSSSWGTWSGEGDGSVELVVEQHWLCDPFSLGPIASKQCDSICHVCHDEHCMQSIELFQQNLHSPNNSAKHTILKQSVLTVSVTVSVSFSVS